MTGFRAWPTVDELAAQEAELQVEPFDNDDAWRLGTWRVEAWRTGDLGVVVDITRNGQHLFHAALPSTSPDNDA